MSDDDFAERVREARECGESRSLCIGLSNEKTTRFIIQRYDEDRDQDVFVVFVDRRGKGVRRLLLKLAAALATEEERGVAAGQAMQEWVDEVLPADELPGPSRLG